jgi:hypothetical protein
LGVDNFVEKPPETITYGQRFILTAGENKNKICYNIINGKISPWMLYHSNSGLKFLDNLDETQVKMIIDYINPEQWAIKFKRNIDSVKIVKELLGIGGY